MLSACLLSSALNADDIYKYVDETGRVSYSSSPANDGSVKLAIQPPPSDEAVKAARERHQQNLRADKILSESREKRERQLAEKNRLKREKHEQAKINKEKEVEQPEQQGPYYGIPGHGILVLPKGPAITPR